MENNYLYTHLIENIRKKIDVLNVDNVGIILRDIRKIIEHTKQNNNYPTLHFYCDWAAHSVIARNKKMYEILDIINVKFEEIHIKDSVADKTYNSYVDIVIDALGLNQLAFEIRKFLCLNFIHIDYPCTSKFINYTFENLKYIKIQYPNDKEMDKKKDASIKKKKAICKIINEKEKFENPNLDPNCDYQDLVICNSFQIVNVTTYVISFEMGVEDLEKKDIKIIGKIFFK